MLGCLRLVLAIAVALSHAGVSAFGHHIGVPAVIIFYVLAGYVVSKQWNSLVAAGSGEMLRTFYLERAIRLLPAYFIALGISAGLTVWLSPVTSFISRPADITCVLSNIMIVPLNYFMFNGVDRCSLIPVAWSLGLEIQFYILAPLLLWRVTLRRTLALLSLSIYLVAISGWLDTDVWGYRLLPGTLFIFIMGIELAQKAAPAALPQRIWSIISFAFFTLAGVIVVTPTLQRNFALETALGLAVVLPLIRCFTTFTRSQLDDWAGSISYPLFLLHFPVLWFVEQKFDLAFEPRLVVYIIIVFVTAFLIATLVDRPLAGIRRRLRVKKDDVRILSRK